MDIGVGYSRQGGKSTLYLEDDLLTEKKKDSILILKCITFI